MTDPAKALDSFRLDGRVAIVTGASSGLGARFSRVLAAAGAQVAVAARRADRLDELAADLGAAALPVACDVGDDADLARLVDTTLARFGQIDVLVNNAGVGDVTRALDTPVERFREIVAVNLTASFALSQLVGRHMIDRGTGSIVNVASILGLVAAFPASDPAYAASKAGLINLTRDLAVQWARRGVRVNALAPGFFETEMTADMFADERSLAFLERNTPLGRPGMSHELDGALLFLASDASSYVTGQVLAVDGGWTAR